MSSRKVLALLVSLSAACAPAASVDPGPDGSGGSGGGAAVSLSCTPEPVELGEVVSGASRSVPLRCVATGGPVTLASAVLSGTAAASFSVALPAGGVTVEPGLALELPVGFTAAAPGSADATLSLLDATGASLAQQSLHATVIEHALALLPELGSDSCHILDTVRPGGSSETVLVLQNLSQDPVTVTGVSLTDGAAAGFAAHVTLPATVAPGASLEIAVTFEPIELGSHPATLVVTSDDPGRAQLSVCLHGFCGGPVLSCSPSAIDFGQVAIGFPLVRSFACTNAGTDDPNSIVQGLVVEGVSTNDGELGAQIRGGLRAGGYPAGESFTVDVTYSPLDEGIDELAVVLRSNDPVTPEHHTRITGHGRDLPPCQFEVRPNQLRFGIVERGNTVVLELAIANTGATECLISELRLADGSDPAFTLQNGPVAAVALPGFAELRVAVAFLPPQHGDSYESVIQFNISDPQNPLQVVHVSGVSREPCLVIAPDDLDFGTVQPGCSTRDRELQIINVCASPITVTEIELNAGASAEFFVRTRPTFPKVIAAGLSAEFTMSYRPTDEGVDLGSVLITTREATEPYMATVRGSGAFGAPQGDVFVQTDRPRADLLFVIENSASMAEEQAQLASGAALFLQSAIARQLDFQLGFTTTGFAPAAGCPGGAQGAEAGALFPVDGSHPQILTASTANLEEHWAFNTSVGTCQGGGGMGLEAAYRALAPPHLSGFLRPDAHLALIFVSDAEDQSPQTTDFYANFFLSLKGFRNENLFSAHAIVGDPLTGCLTAEAGDRYLDVATRSGGVFQSVCQADWSQTLETIGTAATGFKTRFFLSGQPEDGNGNGIISDADGELEVRLDGINYPSVGPRGDRRWEYQAGLNAVDFYPLALPEPGTRIEIHYATACL